MDQLLLDESEASAAAIGAAAVVGAGTIGLGWAHLLCRAGIETTVHDPDSGRLRAFEGRLAAALDTFVADGRLTHGAAAQAHARLRLESDLDAAVAGVDYVQESVPEVLEIKADVFERASRAASPRAILASSSSTLPMTRIAERATGPERCVIAHPTNPPHLLPLVEIVPGERTSERVVAVTWALQRRLGQQPILCRKEIFGFVLNRLQFALLREALFLMRAGVADVADIDRCVSDGLGLRWAFLGPFAVEATNADGLADDLSKFGDVIRDLVADVGQPYDGPTDEDIATAVEQFEQLRGGRSPAELREYRDRMVLALRALKDGSRHAGATSDGVERDSPLLPRP